MNYILKRFIGKAKRLNSQGKFPLVFKVYRLIRVLLVSFKNLCQGLIYSTSVTFHLPWAHAYYRMGERYRRKLFQIIDSDDYQKETANKVYHRAFNYLERACQLRPHFVKAAREMARMAMMTGGKDGGMPGTSICFCALPQGPIGNRQSI